ncbi:MAG: hypothetical protein LBD23_01670 [Oscillospiraceae bacterium]|jgi:hypothetical protein|nr:hypothetical protein [Oscillospiraceae bacterium]
MKNAFILFLSLLIILFITAGCGGSQLESYPEVNQGIQELPPHLDVHLHNTLAPQFQGQTISAIQLGMSWLYYDENGIGKGIEADALHPLQMKPDSFNDATINMSTVRCDCIEGKNHIAVELRFSDNYPPESFSVIRWGSDLVTGNQEIDDLISLGEQVVADGYKILIFDDGIDYLYAVFANWSEGRSYYTFRTSAM